MPQVSNAFCGLALLFLVDFSECSFNGNGRPNLHENSQRVFDIQVHGILCWASMGLLMPVGVLAMRMSSCSQDVQPSRHRLLFYVHAISQVLSVLAITVGAVLSMTKFENLFDNSHQRIGLALYAAIYLQVLIGFKRPNRGIRCRRTWYFAHWLLGTATCLVGILNVYMGLYMYHVRTHKSPNLWAVIFSAQISLMGIFYLFQDKWGYIVKQGMNSESLEEVELGSQEVENGEYSNPVGSHFMRQSSHNKLFKTTYGPIPLRAADNTLH